jgi:SAM-dependent methyltransferase
MTHVPEMSEREIVSAIKYVSRMKPEFTLSEIQDYIKSETTTEEVFNVIRPLLFDLGLTATPAGGDYKVTRIPPAKVLVMSKEELAKHEIFFKSPAVPRKLERIVEQYVEKKTDKKLDDPVMLEKIRKAIAAQKAQYWKEGDKRNITYETGYSILGYLTYQFPVYFAQFEHTLKNLADDGLLKTRMKVLDVGTGPGTVPLAIIDFYNRLDQAEVKIYSLEKFDENIEAYGALVPEYAANRSNVDVEKPIKADLLKLPMDKIPDQIDLLVFSNVLNELNGVNIDHRTNIVMELAKKLSPDGNIVIIEPAEKIHSMEMRKTVLALQRKGLNIYSPCSFIWCARCNPISCWSFEQKEDIAPTRLMELVAKCDEPYRYMNTDIKYSYAILRKDNLSREKYVVPPKAHFARFSDLNAHVNKRINVVASKMSNDLGDKKNRVFKVCDGTSIKPVYAIIPSYHEDDNNSLLITADYGEVLELEGVVARLNKDFDSYNLLITRNSKITKAGE